MVSAITLIIVGALAWIQVTAARTSSAYQPGREAAHVRTLARALDAGAGQQMQTYFPEGEFFTWTLTGLAAGRLAEKGVDPEQNMAVVTAAVAAIDRPQIADRFGSGHRGLAHGAFYHGWRLLLHVQQARTSGDETQLAAVQADAKQLLAALDTDGPPLTSYPGQAWPCDLVVAWAAVHQANALRPVTGITAATDRLIADIDAWRDPDTGLIGHMFTTDGTSVSGARGSSQAIINTYLRDISPSLADQEWSRFSKIFVTSSYGLVGVREYPAGVAAPGDVDSGPLIGGVSLSASAVTLGAARANAALGLAAKLSSQAELLGAPLPWLGVRGLDGRTFAFGTMPVGDAFVVAARTQPVGIVTSSDVTTYPATAWSLWYTLAKLPVLAGALLLFGEERRSRRSR